MHDKNLVHTRIHPSSIRLHGKRHIRLSRLMCVRSYKQGSRVKGDIPLNPREYFFISPERFRQKVDLNAVFGSNMTPEQLEAERVKLIPQDTVPWDGKMDDVWAFGCVTFFLLTAKYPFSRRHSSQRSVLEGFRQDFVIRRVREWPTLSQGARDFILWILRPEQQERPTMDQILDHPWLTNNAAIRSNRLDYLSTDADVRARTFRQVVGGHIDSRVIGEMVAEGYGIQRRLGQGSFGAVFK